LDGTVFQNLWANKMVSVVGSEYLQNGDWNCGWHKTKRFDNSWAIGGHLRIFLVFLEGSFYFSSEEFRRRLIRFRHWLFSTVRL
jgi:hypothetical protein